MLKSRSSGRYVFLDGMRGWGSLFVLLCHIFTWEISFLSPDVRSWLILMLPFNGPFAVGVFFLVSGFSLAVGFLETRDRKLLARLAVGRYFRLTIPIFFVCGIVYLMIKYNIIITGNYAHVFYRSMFKFDNNIFNLLKFSFFDVYFNYKFEMTFIGPLWTMSYELFGSYILMICLLFSPGRSTRFVVFMLVCVLCLYLILPVGLSSYLSLFILGALLAQAYLSGWVAALPAPMLIAMLIVGAAGPFVNNPWSPNGQATFFIILFCTGCVGLARVRDFLSSPLSRFLGTVSFPLYLIHGPLMHLVGEPLLRTYGYSIPIAAMLDIILVLLSFMAAILLVPVDRFGQQSARWIGSAAANLAVRHRKSPA